MSDKKFSSILNFFKLDDDEDDDEYNSIDDDVDEEPVSFRKNRTTPVREETRQARPTRPAPSKPKVVPIRSGKGGGPMEVNIIKPTSFEDSQDICNTLLRGQAVVVNLEGFDPDEAQRIMDFISGCVYAISGKINQISQYIFIISPENVEISGNYIDAASETFGVPTLSRDF